MMTPEEMEALPVQARVDIWRQKQIAGTLTDEDMRQAIQVIREGRVAAAALGATRKAAKGPPRSAEELLASFLESQDGEQPG
jgi:ribosomal protein L12E/L44/L45/RPP1/RPP2